MYKAEVIGIDEGLATLKITVEAERAADAVRRALRGITSRVNIPGFRKGKAPRTIVERFVGIEAIYDDAIRDFAPEAYEQALREAELKPIAEPEFEGLQDAKLESGDDVVFTAKVWIAPKVTLADYSSMKLTREAIEVTEADIDGVLEQLREDRAEYVPVERAAAESGDLVTVDIDGFLDGDKRDALSVSDIEVVVGGGQLIPGLDDHIAGMKVNEPADVVAPLPVDHPDPELAGREVTFKVTVKGIKAKQLPELNDELAREIEGIENLVQLRDRVTHNMHHRALEEAVRKLAVDALNRITAGSEVGESRLLLDDRLNKMVDDIKHKAEEQGLEWERYLEMRSKTEEELRSDFSETAAARVKSDLIVDEIAAREGLIPTEREVSITLLNMIGDVERIPQNVIEKLLAEPELRRSAYEVAVRTAVLGFLGRACDSDPDSATCETCAADHEHNHAHGHCDCHDHDHDHDHDHGHDHANESEVAEQE